MDLDRFLTAFRLQIGICRHLGSPFYAELLEQARDDLEAGGPIHALVRDFDDDPLRGYLPLRILGVVHARVLAGHAPALADYYPTCGGRADARAAWPHFRDFVEAQRDSLAARLDRHPQTNEVRRCAGLLPGFLTIAHATGLPLRLLEIGCSAGLNLQWSRFRYALGAFDWGDPAAAVRLTTDWRGPAPEAAIRSARVEIVERAGCDLAPRGVDDAEAVRELECFVWADQPERLAQLRGAIEVARADPPRIERASATDWLPARLAERAKGACTVVYHSAMWIYMPPEDQAAVMSAIESAGATATPERPLAWLRAESPRDRPEAELHLRVWPGGEERHLADVHAHGAWVEWWGDAGR